ncbi:hypothetical protein AAF712_007820 [Marasmius tenuissimus]|uniref:DUF6535 domain-containing protein n=1 Tax=Marasmius tenuissimus TaxID=585030 RepID=A0ABR2ZV30_9AGAR
MTSSLTLVEVGLGTKSLLDMGVQDTKAAPLDTGVGGLDGMKTNNRTGNENIAEGFSDPIKPTPEKSWEVIMTEVNSLDDGLVGGWKDDIDTLLVFAGLFSAVVTAFTVESYKWLQEEPEDTTVALLRQISQQLNNTSVPKPDEFAASSSVVAVNVLWFLSLIISLVDALFALLCKQWLREHRRHTRTRTPSEALALRWLRNQGLEKWNVPAILASLPILLEIALFLFLAGLLELLRTRHPVPFALAMAVVAFAALFYLGTTIIPTVDIIRQALQIKREFRDERLYYKAGRPAEYIMTLPPMEYVCPYKSPQARVTLKILRLISHILRPLVRVASFLVDRNWITSSVYLNLENSASAFGESSSLLDWSSVDLKLLQRSNVHLAPPFYELDAFRSLVSELRDSPHMVPHLRNVLSTIPLHLVMPAVFDQWFFLPGRNWAIGDVEAALGPNFPDEGVEYHLTHAKYQYLREEGNTDQFRRLLHWTNVSMNGGNQNSRDSPPPFSTPFESTDANPDNYSRGRLWDIYLEIVQNPAASDHYWMTLVPDLAPHIIASSPDYALHLPTATTTSSFVKSPAGCDFLYKIHTAILKSLSSSADPIISNILAVEGSTNWTEAMDIVRRVHGLPEGHFRVIPGQFSLSVSKFRKTLESLSLSPTATDPETETDFSYLSSFIRGWDSASDMLQNELVKTLSGHINDYPQSHADESRISPLVMSPAGLELITFVNNSLAEPREWTNWHGLEVDGRMRWRDAVERVKAAHPELPSDHFKRIIQRGIDPDLPASAPGERSPQQEAGVEARAEDSDSAPRDVTDTREADRDGKMEGRTNSIPSLQPKPGETDERGPLVGNAEQGSILKQPVAAGNPASSGAASVQGKMVGGPDADKNV